MRIVLAGVGVHTHTSIYTIFERQTIFKLAIEFERRVGEVAVMGSQQIALFSINQVMYFGLGEILSLVKDRGR